MRKTLIVFSLTLGLLSVAAALSPLQAADAPEASKETSQEEKPIGGEAGEKGGIYVVGRAFKSAGGSMEKGFKKAGSSMEGGFKKAGSSMEKGFKKAGSSMKDFFTGEKKED